MSRRRRTPPHTLHFEALEPRQLLSLGRMMDPAAWATFWSEASGRQVRPAGEGPVAHQAAAMATNPRRHHHRHGFNKGGHPGFGLTALAIASVGPTVSVQATTPTATEGGHPGVFTLTETGGSGGIQVAFKVINSASTQAYDYNLYDANWNQIPLSTANGVTTATVGLSSGASTATVRVVPNDDPLGVDDAGGEAVTLQVLDPPSGGSCCCCYCSGPAYTAGSPASATVTLPDNDVAVTGGGATAEGDPGTPMTFDVHRSGDPGAALSITLDTTGSTAVPGVDYRVAATADSGGGPAPTTVTIATAAGPAGSSVAMPAGATDVLITVTPLDPTDPPGGWATSKVLQMRVVGGSCCYGMGDGPGYGVDSPASASLTIADPDAGTPSVTLGTAPGTAVEGGANGAFVLTRSNDDGPLTVGYTVTGVGGATAGGDYTLSPAGNSVTFPDGVATIRIAVAAGEGPNGEPAGRGCPCA